MPNYADASVRFVRDPNLKHIEARFSRYNRPTFSKHVHETYAIGVVEQGVSSFLHRHTTHIIGPGTVVLLNPGEVHACNPVAQAASSYRMFYVDIDLLCAIMAGVAGSCQGLPYFTEDIVQSPALVQSLLQLYAVLLESAPLPEKDARINATLTELVLQYSDYPHAPRFPHKPYKPIQKAYAYLMDNLAQNIPLAQLAAIAGLSEYHLLRIFRDHFGLPPHTFQVQQRINVAKRMLAEGATVIQAACELGFTDQSHFTKKFKALVGATPRQYQAAPC